MSSYAWTAKNSRSRSHLVGQKKANAFGLYDMSGNVFEWVEDRYDKNYYSKSPEMNPKGPATGTSRVMRGGSWYSHPNFSRSAYRAQNDPSSQIHRQSGFAACWLPYGETHKNK